MLLKQIERDIDILVDEILAGIDNDKGAIIWRNFIRRTRPYEVKFRKKLQELFRAQEKEVLDNMKKHPHPDRRGQIDTSINVTKQNWLSDWLFAEMMWQRRFSNNGKPFIGGVLEDVGQAELADIISGIDFDITNPRVQTFINSNANKFSFEVNKTTIASLRKELTAGIKLGEGIPELTKRVNKVFGFAEKYRATRIARSEVIRAANAGAEFGYMQSGVVEGKEWLIAEDERLCDFCRYMSEEMNQKKLGEVWFKKGDKLELPDGQIMKIDYSDIGYPPLHSNCRCTIIPVLKE